MNRISAGTSLLFALSLPIIACGGLDAESELTEDQDAVVVGPGTGPVPVTTTRIAYRSGAQVRSMVSDGSGDVFHANGLHPSYSEDRTRMVYATSNGDLIVVQAPFDAAAFANAETIFLGHAGAGVAVEPSFNRDGTRIVYATEGTGGYDALIYKTDIHGTYTTLVVAGWGTYLYSPAFSADGTQIAYTTGNPSVINGLSIRRVSATAVNVPAANGTLVVSGAYRPTYSPNGLKLAYYKYIRGSGYDIFIADANGTNPVAYAGNSDYDDVDPDFSPSSSSIAFVSKRDYYRCDGTPVCVHGNTSQLGSNLFRGTVSGSSIEVLTFNNSATPLVASPSWE